MLVVNSLSKSFGDRVLFEDVSFSIVEGQRVAIVGRNGCGKSTLLDILAGHQSADSGSITCRRDLRVAYLSQANVEPTPPTGEKALRYEQYLSKLKVRGTHSGGEIKRMCLAAVLAEEPDLLILDEPTNHLDLEMVIWLEDFLSRSRMALLMVTHDRYFLDRVCSDIIEIDQQRIFTYHGNYSYYLEKRTERIETFNSETERMRNLYRYELDWMRRMPCARGHKSRERKENFYQLEERVHQSIAEKDVHLENRGVYIGSKIFEAKAVCKAFNPEKVILRDFNYVFSRYEKLGIIGNNGTGKTTFIRLLLGEEQTDSGCFDIGETVRFGYFSQTGLTADPGKKVLDIITAEAEYIDLGAGNKLSASQFLQHFLFSPSQQRDYVEKLSGGERQRLNLCRVLMRNPNFLILDEPTNDLDIQTMNILEDYLRHFRGCLMVVSHDRYFMDKVVDHLLVFRGQGEVKDYPGNYTQWREAEEAIKQSAPARRDPSTTAAPAAERGKQKTEAKRRLSYKEQQELKALEESLPLLEQEKAELEMKLSGGLTDMTEIQAASARYEEVKNTLDEQELRWLELTEIGS